MEGIIKKIPSVNIQFKANATFGESDWALSEQLECELIGDYDFQTVTNFDEAVTAFHKIDDNSTEPNHVPMFIYLTPFHEISDKFAFQTKKMVTGNISIYISDFTVSGKSQNLRTRSKL